MEVPKVAGTNKAHGNPLGVEEATATKTECMVGTMRKTSLCLKK